MSRNEYMKEMGYHLRRLPKEDLERAMEYFEEYFDEAGPEHEQQAAEDLGAPDLAADQIIRELAIENAKSPNPSVKRGVSAVWVGILAVFAVPVGLPLALAAGCLAFAFVLVICSLLFAVLITAAALAVSIVPLLGGSIWLLFTSPANGLASLGFSLIAAGIGIWGVKGCIWLCRWFLNVLTRLFGRIVNKGAKYEKQN